MDGVGGSHGTRNTSSPELGGCGKVNPGASGVLETLPTATTLVPVPIPGDWGDFEVV